jgi:alkylation response protein AidB-like acyl-CoA dehydrogenase
MLERFRGRARELDRTNTYFHEDLAELREFGYLAAAVPEHLGGWGLDVAEMTPT